MIQVEVTQQDITKGLGGNCHLCPVTLALRRVFPGYGVLDIATLGPRVLVGWKAIQSPASVSQFAGDFDNGYPVSPFTFELPDLDSDQWKEIGKP